MYGLVIYGLISFIRLIKSIDNHLEEIIQKIDKLVDLQNEK